MIPGGLTPTQFAKETLLDFMGRAGYWEDRLSFDEEAALTEKEKEAIYRAMQKHYDRVQKFLGYEGYTLG